MVCGWRVLRRAGVPVPDQDRPATVGDVARQWGATAMHVEAGWPTRGPACVLLWRGRSAVGHWVYVAQNGRVYDPEFRRWGGRRRGWRARVVLRREPAA